MRNETRVFVRNLLAEVSRPSGARETEETPDHPQSDFARWYEGAGRELFGNLPAFQEVEAPHAGLFAAAGSLRAALRAGDREEALRAGDREEALRAGGELSRNEGDLLARLDVLNAAISEKQK